MWKDFKESGKKMKNTLKNTIFSLRDSINFRTFIPLLEEQRTANSEQRTANSEQRSEQRTANSEQRTANSEQLECNDYITKIIKSTLLGRMS